MNNSKQKYFTMVELSIVLPAYRESENLRVLLPKLHEVASSLTRSYEILVVDSQDALDDTDVICKATNTKHVRRRGGCRYGHAVRTGISYANGTYVIMMDADGSHNPIYLPKLWTARSEASVVVASRYIDGGSTDNSFILILLSRIVNLTFRLMLRINVLDVSNSFRLYNGELLRRIPTDCLDFDIVEEILVKIVSQNPDVRLKEVPINFEKRQAGKTKRNLFMFALSYFATLLRLLRFRFSKLPKGQLDAVEQASTRQIS